ncbi:MAG: hypothetical protein EPN21_00680 [Methylococcaceae bacterium]|nr:MAG: hypothetical protein EPN21_00680 [Methylococcaceae bacterium]
MSVIPIRSNGLPDWFTLERYDECLEWTAAEWGDVLWTRAQYMSCVNNGWGITDLMSDDPNLNKSEVLKTLEAGFECELAIPESHELRDCYDYRSVAYLSVYQAMMVNEHLGELGALASEEYMNEVTAFDGRGRDELETSYDETLRTHDLNTEFDPGYVHITANLHVPDDLLVEHFKLCIAELREKLQWKSHTAAFSKDDLAGWHKARVLPYLDLKLWSAATGARLTYAAIGAALFPGEYNIDLVDRVRRTVKPKAEWLLSETIINTLLGQCRSFPGMT